MQFMKSLKKQFSILLFAVILLLAVPLCANAAGNGGIYVNGPEGLLPGALTEAYAAGADGTALIGAQRCFALTGAGLREIGANEEEGGTAEPVDYTGGGGLLYDDGSVHVATDRLRVGLYYYYSKNRDTSLEEARLENETGSGYAFGYLDENRCFVPYGGDAMTQEAKIAMRPLGNGAIGVYITGTDELLYTAEHTDASSYFAIHPLSEEDETRTWFKGKQYYGDFAYADLGNEQLTVVNIVGVEHYVAGVVSGEMGSGFPLEALKAQAVAARSYAMYTVHAAPYAARCGFDLTADEYSQVYTGYIGAQNVLAAVRDTENQYLTYNGSIVDALFFAADGGETLDSEAVFPSALPYLRGVKDPYEEMAWTRGPYGHQVGLSQWGAYAMAKYFEKDYKDILGFYYTGVGLSYGYL